MSSWDEAILKVKKCLCHTSTVAQCDREFKPLCQPEFNRRLTKNTFYNFEMFLSHFAPSINLRAYLLSVTKSLKPQCHCELVEG
jgi:hypothetical protein